MFIIEAIKEEWSKTTVLGRVTWVPVFAILLPAAVALVIPLIPLLYLMMLADKPIAKWSRCLRGLFFK